MKGNVTEQKLTQGQTIYVVSVPPLGGPIWITPYMVMSRPYMEKLISGTYAFIKVTKLGGIASGIMDSISLDDENIHPHKNRVGALHRVFYKKRDAERYKERIKKELGR